VNFDDLINELQSGPTSFQASADAKPWTLGAAGFERSNSDETVLAPSPGAVYDEHHSLIGKYTKVHEQTQKRRKGISTSRRSEPGSLGSYGTSIPGTPEYHGNNSPDVLAECSGDLIEYRGRRSPETLQQPDLCHPVQYGQYSLETLVSIFHPSTQLLPSTLN
jgi:hypothetical protein